MFNTNSEFDQRVRRRLAEELVIWLTTIDSKGRPQPRPVWFWWDGASFLIYSATKTYKVKHIEANPNVSLNFDGDGRGGNIVIFSGEATIEKNPTPPNEVPAYVEKYAEGMTWINMNPAQFAEAFPTAIRVTPTKVRGQ